MANAKKHQKTHPEPLREPVPPGATRKAFEREPNGGNLPGSPLGDRHAAGTPGGGTEFGGLAGTTIGDGAPENADLDPAMGTGVDDQEDIEEEGPPYSGPSGGAVGGTPAQGRSSGGRVHRGIDPEGTHRGDSTIGGDPDHGSEGA